MSETVFLRQYHKSSFSTHVAIQEQFFLDIHLGIRFSYIVAIGTRWGTAVVLGFPEMEVPQ